MEDATRTPLEQLESEAIYLLRESAALFEKPALVLADDERSQVLAELARRAFAPGPSPLTTVDQARGDHDAFLSPEMGANFEVWPLFGKPPRKDEPWRVFPLASWSSQDIADFAAETHSDDSPRLLRLCTVGEAESGKSTVVRGLMKGSMESDGQESIHRHLRTSKRRMFIIDPPGQEPCSHGLLAAASAAEVAVLVVDATRGLTSIAKRQAFLLALMGVPQLVVVVNKMDLVGYSEHVYQAVVEDVEAASSLIEMKNLTFLPVAALHSGNLVEADPKMPWYQGPTLLSHLESVTPGSLWNLTDLRLPVQRVLADGRPVVGGRLASGRLAIGDKVVILPSGIETEVACLKRGRDSQQAVYAGDSVTIELADQAEVDEGDIIASPLSLPTRCSELEAVILWLDNEPQQPEKRYLLHHGTRLVSAHVAQVLAGLEPESMTWDAGERLERGTIARARVVTGAPLYFDSYTSNREMGAFAILDWETRAVLGAGVLRGPALEIPDVTASAERLSSEHVVKDPTLVPRRDRRGSYGHEAAVLWFTGLSGSGKSAVAKEVEKRLFERGCHTLFLDGDNVRSGLNGDLGFTEEARTESTRRVAELAKLVFEQGQIVVCSFISGKREDRDFVRSLIKENHFFECYVRCPIDVCRSRDPKDLYKKADAGELLSFSGISIPYDEPENPHLVLPSDKEEVEALADLVMLMLVEKGILARE